MARPFFRRPLLRLCAALAPAGMALPAAAQITTMIVMDGSGSMSGQIDGQPPCFADRPGTEFGLAVSDPAEGFVSGMKPDVTGLIFAYVPIGQEFTVRWSGPADVADRVGIAPPDHGAR